ncbi:MAG: hypothetical protein ACRD8A_06135 [Candidatus Acidiferrales bacterium]
MEDVLDLVEMADNGCHLPFDPDEVIDNLRLERYLPVMGSSGLESARKDIVRSAYYRVRPFLPVAIRKHLQRVALRGWDQRPFPKWPVDHTVDCILEKLFVLALQASGAMAIPFIWFWPDGSRAAATMTHDVETSRGRDSCIALMDLNDSFGVKSSFQFVPEQRYAIPERLFRLIRDRGFEINVHDLNHDGLLFRNHEEFLRRAAKINQYVRKFEAVGYRSGALYRNPDWYDAFEFSYDMSFPNVAHLDPQSGGCCTTKPYFIGKILELPVTAAQDYTLFHILEQYSAQLWKNQIELISAKHGMANFVVHPDYVMDARPRKIYAELLEHLSDLRRDAKMWIALPREIDAWWRARKKMTLECDHGTWRIEGPESHRARIAFARIENNLLVYDLQLHSNGLLAQPVS